MAINQKKKQKKLNKKKQKRKAVQKKMSSFKSKFSKTNQMMMAINSPYHECFVRKDLFDDGIGSITVSRKMPNGNIALSMFLLDVWCLGIKNADFKVFSENEYESVLKSIRTHQELENIHPAYALKLIEKCVEYAQNLGFKPHSDYALSLQIFGDTDVSGCTKEYEFGKDGKPYYISGPKETESRSTQICNSLMKKCGDGNFHYTINITPENLSKDNFCS
jgi:hypothetical protein